MTTIINPLPNTFVNGTTIDATQVNANFNQIVANVNANGAGSGANNDITSLNALTTPIPSAAGGVPTGAMMAFGSTTPPGGWLLCDGSAVSRSTYAALYAVVGNGFGPGNGTTTFNLPDMRGRVAAGYDAGNATARLTGSPTGGVSAAAINNSGGEQGHVLTTLELATHSHSVNDPSHTHTVTDPGHAHGAGVGAQFALVTGGNNVAGGSTFPIQAASATTQVSTGVSNQNNVTGVNLNTTGASNSHNNVQPTLIVPWIIKT